MSAAPDADAPAEQAKRLLELSDEFWRRVCEAASRP